MFYKYKNIFLFVILWCNVFESVYPTLILLNALKKGAQQTRCKLHQIGSKLIQHDHSHGDPCQSDLNNQGVNGAHQLESEHQGQYSGQNGDHDGHSSQHGQGQNYYGQNGNQFQPTRDYYPEGFDGSNNNIRPAGGAGNFQGYPSNAQGFGQNNGNYYGAAGQSSGLAGGLTVVGQNSGFSGQAATGGLNPTPTSTQAATDSTFVVGKPEGTAPRPGKVDDINKLKKPEISGGGHNAEQQIVDNSLDNKGGGAQETSSYPTSLDIDVRANQDSSAETTITPIKRKFEPVPLGGGRELTKTGCAHGRIMTDEGCKLEM